MQAPYSGPETTTSLQVLEELASSGLPQPVMLLGGWAVYFTVRDAWLTTFGEEYFGSRDFGYLTGGGFLEVEKQGHRKRVKAGGRVIVVGSKPLAAQ